MVLKEGQTGSKPRCQTSILFTQQLVSTKSFDPTRVTDLGDVYMQRDFLSSVYSRRDKISPSTFLSYASTRKTIIMLGVIKTNGFELKPTPEQRARYLATICKYCFSFYYLFVFTIFIPISKEDRPINTLINTIQSLAPTACTNAGGHVMVVYSCNKVEEQWDV